jgi:DNA-directed RNA polymerase specialized sigma24 family protein
MTEIRLASRVVSDDNSEGLADPAGKRGADLVDVRLWLRREVPSDSDLVFAIVAGGLNCRQVAEALGISHASARQRLARALAVIRRRIAEPAVTV